MMVPVVVSMLRAIVSCWNFSCLILECWMFFFISMASFRKGEVLLGSYFLHRCLLEL